MRLIDSLRRRYRKIAGPIKESHDSAAGANLSAGADSSSDTSKPLRAINITKDIEIASRVEWAGDSETRRRGLLGRDHIDTDEGMYIVPTQWIHMFGMRFPIDVAFLASDGRVLFIHHSLCPNRFSRPVWRAEGALELAAGTLEATGTAVGDVIELR
jgi:uncharacterized membrane protein (UPF0127 family)